MSILDVCDPEGVLVVRAKRVALYALALFEILVVQALETAAVSSLVLSHFVNGVVCRTIKSIKNIQYVSILRLFR